MKQYKLGNGLRGYFGGEFKDDDTAWRYLSNRFLLSYPSKTGRSVEMLVEENNRYGIEQWIVVKRDTTWLGKLNKAAVMRKCKSI